MLHPAIPDGRAWSNLGGHGEPGEHGKGGKPQPDHLKHSLYDSKRLFVTQNNIFVNQMTQNTLFVNQVNQNTRFVNQKTQNTLFYSFCESLRCTRPLSSLSLHGVQK